MNPCSLFEAEATERPTITPDWTLGELKRTFPGVELILFSQFGIGSRERSGFSADERLEDLLRRHLIFDASKACERLSELAAEDLRFQISPSQLEQLLPSPRVKVIDVRSRDDYRRAGLPGALYLDAPTVARLQESGHEVVVAVCNDGSQGPSASRVLRTQGIEARHLAGGLAQWSRQVDPEHPILYPLEETPGCWHLLADGHTLRRRFHFEPEQRAVQWDRAALLERRDGVSEIVRDLPELEFVVVTPASLAVRGLRDNLTSMVGALRALRSHHETLLKGGRPCDRDEERAVIEKVLQKEAPRLLASHKGTVEVASYRDGVLVLRLGGGCAGCASAAITTKRELAAALYREVPSISRIENAE